MRPIIGIVAYVYWWWNRHSQWGLTEFNKELLSESLDSRRKSAISRSLRKISIYLLGISMKRTWLGAPHPLFLGINTYNARDKGDNWLLGWSHLARQWSIGMQIVQAMKWINFKLNNRLSNRNNLQLLQLFSSPYTFYSIHRIWLLYILL